MTRPDQQTPGKAKPGPDSAETDKFRVEAEAQQKKMDAAAEKHAGKMRGNTEPNAGGQNRESGDRKARQNDRTTNGGGR